MDAGGTSDQRQPGGQPGGDRPADSVENGGRPAGGGEPGGRPADAGEPGGQTVLVVPDRPAGQQGLGVPLDGMTSEDPAGRRKLAVLASAAYVGVYAAWVRRPVVSLPRG